MKNTIRYTALLFFLLLAVKVHSASYTLRGLSVSDGLSDLVVNAIYKDSLGFVWMGTGNSLDRFDGIHFVNYSIPGANEKLKRVNAIVEMAGNSLWIGNGMGLWCLNPNQTALEQVAPERINSAVHALLHDGKGVLYIGSDRGLFIYHQGSLEQILLDKNAFSSSNSVTGLVMDDDGVLWMATGSGLCSLQLSNRQITVHHQSDDTAFHSIARIDTMLYLGTMDQGILSYDTRSQEFDHFVDVGCNVISSLSTDGKRLLYVGTDGNGVHFIDTQRKEVVRTMQHETGREGGLRSNSVYSLLVDRDGMIWVGFYQFGLDYTLYQSDLFDIYAFPPVFNSKDMPIRTVWMGGHEKLIGSRDGLFYIDEERHRFKSFRAPVMRSGMVFSILFFEGEYYIGTYGGGMYVFNAETMTLRDFAPALSQPFVKGHVFCIKQDMEQTLWIGTSEGLYRYKDGKLAAHYTDTNSLLPKGNVYEIFFDSTNKGWICTENGICIWDPSSQKLRTDVFPEGFIHKEKIRVVYEDSSHDLYFFPDKGPLFMSDLSMTTYHYLQPGTPLEGRDGTFIIEDPAGWLWLGTSSGLFRYDKKNSFIPYNFIDGIPSPIFTLCPPVCDEAGNLWLGNSKGLLHLDLARLDKDKRAFYPVRVTDIHINGESSPHSVTSVADGDPRVDLDVSQKNVTFCFSDFSYTAPINMTYEYCLEGRDEQWMPLAGHSEVTYYNLSSGSYVFKVRRMGQPESEARLTVKIASFFSAWMIAAVALVLLLGVGAYRFYKYRKSQADPTEEGSVGDAVEDMPASESESAQEEKYKTIRVTAEECQRLLEKLEAVMIKDKPYVNSDLKIADLATAIGTTAHTLSYLFNQHLKRNYYDYINDYRIAEFKRLVDTEEYSRYTLSALAGLCGFSSRASFFRYFKKATGITPNEYIKNKEG